MGFGDEMDKPLDFELHLYRPHNNFQSQPSSVHCRHQVHEQGRGVGFYQCQKKGMYPHARENGSLHEDKTGVILFCDIHHPIRKAERRAEQEAEWSREQKIKTDRWKREEAMADICRGVSTGKLKRLGRGYVLSTLDTETEDL